MTQVLFLVGFFLCSLDGASLFLSGVLDGHYFAFNKLKVTQGEALQFFAIIKNNIKGTFRIKIKTMAMTVPHKFMFTLS